ncbi:MAG: spore germination protein GerPE [Bacillales bacterium]|jgi:spore germination protein PE|nr:spore germination protein GerPE [Bacillales bacterium]
MWQRSSRVENINIKLVTFSGVVQLGEVKYIESQKNTLAIHREHELFFGNEAPFELYKSFYKEPEFEPIYEDIRMTFHHKNPCIHVKGIKLTAVSNNGILHIGNGDSVDIEAKTLHIRQLSNLNNEENKIEKK